jgi:hypothetical protein
MSASRTNCCAPGPPSSGGPSRRFSDTGFQRRSQSGLNHLTQSPAQDWGPKIRVNCMALGPKITQNFGSFVLPKGDLSGTTGSIERDDDYAQA